MPPAGVTTAPLLRVRHSKKVVADEIVAQFPKHTRYVDGTFTDGAVLAAQPRASSRCLLNVDDMEVLTLLEQLQTNYPAVVEHAEFLWEDLSREEFESVAAADQPADEAEAAARTLYLNQLTLPGTKRFDPGNRADRFDWPSLKAWSDRLEGVKCVTAPPLELLDSARPRDLVYLDSSTGLNVEDVLRVASESAARVAVLAAGGADADLDSVAGNFEQVELSRCRPGVRSPDVLYLKTN